MDCGEPGIEAVGFGFLSFGSDLFIVNSRFDMSSGKMINVVTQGVGINRVCSPGLIFLRQKALLRGRNG